MSDINRDVAARRAAKALQAGAQKAKTKEDVILYAESLASLAIMIVRGARGDEYLTEFLTAAINDKGSIAKFERVN
jgi:hypothetical protein